VQFNLPRHFAWARRNSPSKTGVNALMSAFAHPTAQRPSQTNHEDPSMHETMNKVAQVTLAFWIMKICATTLGETGGDLLSMTMNLGYAVSTAIFFGIFLVTLAAQIASRSYHPLMYWAVIISTTTAGTTMSDYLDRSAGLGYIGGSAVLVAILLAVLGAWRFTLGSVSVGKIDNPRAEAFYWTTILFSNTLGTALGDFLADPSGLGLGYEGGALVIAAALAMIAAGYFFTGASRTLLFWLAFILTRPLGATLGDILTKTHAQGGLDLGTVGSSIVLAVFLAACVFLSARSRPRAEVQGDSGGEALRV
jgi:uncharacterized membrane-anchored protein